MVVGLSLRSVVGHSLGVTHLVVEDLADAHPLSVGQARSLARRHGVDAVTRLVAARQVDEPVLHGVRRLPEIFVDYHLADGTTPTVVDSATRAAAAAMQHWRLVTGGEFRLATRAGVLPMHRTREGWATRLGRWAVEAEPVPASAGDRAIEAVRVTLGSSYLVVRLARDSYLGRADLRHVIRPLGSPVRAVIYTQGANGDSVAIRMHEMGHGEVSACGTAASAAALATRFWDHSVEPSLTVQMPGGDVVVRFPISRLSAGEWVEVQAPAWVGRSGWVDLP